MNKIFDIQKKSNNLNIRLIRTAGETGKSGIGRDYVRIWTDGTSEFVTTKSPGVVTAVEQIAAGLWEIQPGFAMKKAAAKYMAALADFRSAGYKKEGGKLLRLDIDGGEIKAVEISKVEAPYEFARAALLTSILETGWAIDVRAKTADGLLKILDSENPQASYYEAKAEKREVRIAHKIAIHKGGESGGEEVKLIPVYRLKKGEAILPGVFRMTPENAAAIYAAAKSRGLEIVPAN